MFTFGIAMLLAASDAPIATPPAAVPEKPKKICREVESTGSRMSKRKCLTAEQWAIHDRGDKAKLELLDQSYKQTAQ